MTHIHFDETGHDNVSKPVKRMRWASQSLSEQNAIKRRKSIIQRLNKRSHSVEEKQTSEETTSNRSKTEVQNENGPRSVYFNMPPPEDASDGTGEAKRSFARNKIRTAKYTPLSFVPRNLWFQFHNIANVYFLFIIVLGVSPI